MLGKQGDGAAMRNYQAVAGIRHPRVRPPPAGGARETRQNARARS
jgi:hypothetical protein